MKTALIDVGGEGEPLLFTHANGYPPGSYRQLFEALKPRFRITAMELRPLWGGREPPRRLSWNVFVDDLFAVLESFDGQRPWLMGHSLGGTVSTLAASRRPELLRGLVLLDPVFLRERYIWAARLTPRGQRRRMPMVRRALSRPERFDSYDEAFTFYRAKRAFRQLSDEALRDYVHASKALTEAGDVELRFSPAWEAAVYESAPRVRGAIKRLSLPTLGLRGSHSDTLSPAMWSRWQHWQPDAVLREVPGGHLFPLEHPVQTAAAIQQNLFAG